MTQTTSWCEAFALTQWEIFANMHFKRYRHTATLLPDSNVFVTGGWDTAVKSELYDFKTQLWTVIADSLGDTLGSYKRESSQVVLLLNGKVLLAGGFLKNTSKSTRNCELYDPATNHFTLTDSLHCGRISGASVLLPDGRVLVTGGYDSPYHWSASCEIYTYGPGVEEKSNIKMQNAKLEAFPNPFIQFTRLAVKDKTTKIQIYDISGKLVEETKDNIIGKKLKPGIYFVSVNKYKPIKAVKMSYLK